MSNVIKYTTTPVNDTIKKGNFALGVNDVDYGPTNITGFYATTIPSTSGYTIYNQSGGTLSYQSVSGTTDLINYLSNKRGVNMTTAGEALSWAAGQSSIFVTNREYENIVTSGMVLNLDAGFVSSYPTSATTWYDLSYSGYNGTLVNGPTFNSFSGGSIVFDGVNDYGRINQLDLTTTNKITVSFWFKFTSTTAKLPSEFTTNSDNTTGAFQIGTSAINPGDLYAHIYQGGYNMIRTSASYNDGSYHNVVFVFDLSLAVNQKIQCYVDGNVVSKIQMQSANVTANFLKNDLYIFSRAGTSFFQPGTLNNYQLYNRALSPFEVYQNYNAMKGRFGIPDIVTSGLTLNMDAGNPYSYNPLNTGSTTWVNTTNITSGGTLTNGTFYSGGTMVFDGVDDYTSVSNFMGNTNTFTVSHFIYLNGSQNTRTIFSNYGVGNNGWVTGIRDDQNNVFKFYLGNTVHLYSNTVLSSFTWYHVAVTYNNGSPIIYVNGVLDNSSSNTITFASSYFGNDIGRLGFGSQYFKGTIGNVQVYNRALNPIEIYQNFNALKNRYGFYDMVQEGLVLNLDASNPNSYNPLNTGSTTWTDVSGNGNNGTLTNGASYTGGTIFLDGTDDYVNCGTGSTLTFNNGTNLNDIPFTIGVWVKFNSVSGYQLVIAKSDYGSSPNKREFLFFTNADSRIHINLMNSDNYNNRIGRYYNTVLSTNTWYHMFATYDGSKLESGLKIYINGVRVDDTSDSAGTYSGLSRTTTPFSFGTDWNNYPNQGNKLSGYYGLGQVYRRELSAGEIAQNFNALRGRYGI